MSKREAALEKALTHSRILKVFRFLLTENVSLLENAETTKDPHPAGGGSMLRAATSDRRLAARSIQRSSRRDEGLQAQRGTGEHAAGLAQSRRPGRQGRAGQLPGRSEPALAIADDHAGRTRQFVAP